MNAKDVLSVSEDLKGDFFKAYSAVAGRVKEVSAIKDKDIKASAEEQVSTATYALAKLNIILGDKKKKK